MIMNNQVKQRACTRMIVPVKGSRKDICRFCNCTAPTLSVALSFACNSLLGRRIRVASLNFFKALYFDFSN